MQALRRCDQVLCEVCIDAPVARLVGIGERTSGHAAVDDQVIQLGLMGTQTDLDIAQALASAELGEGHAEKLIEAGEALHVAIPVVALHGPTKRTQRQVIHELCEHEATLVHGDTP